MKLEGQYSAKIPMIALMAVVAVGCAESSSSGGKKKPASTTQPGGSSNVANGELCTNLMQQQPASDPNFQDFISQFCGGILNTLRSPNFQYKGSGTPNIDPSAVQKGKQSQMQLWASMATPSDAKSYFNLMRLQTSRPDDFKNQGFDYDQAIKYEVLNNNGNAVSYHYTNRKEELTVEYNATSVFIEAVPDKLYIITSKLDQALGIVKTFRGLQIIYQSTGDQGNFTEVFSMSDQLYDNNDDHETTVAKSKNEFVQDMARGYRNSLQSQKANQFFP